MKYTIPAKPTMYKGTLFRSRHEAKWAAFFDACGWPWTYEPIDLPGWSPDFALHGSSEGPMYVEVKYTDQPGAEIDAVINKMQRALAHLGDDGQLVPDALLLGQGPTTQDHRIGRIGWLVCIDNSDSYMPAYMAYMASLIGGQSKRAFDGHEAVQLWAEATNAVQFEVNRKPTSVAPQMGVLEAEESKEPKDGAELKRRLELLGLKYEKMVRFQTPKAKDSVWVIHIVLPGTEEPQGFTIRQDWHTSCRSFQRSLMDAGVPLRKTLRASDWLPLAAEMVRNAEVVTLDHSIKNWIDDYLKKSQADDADMAEEQGTWWEDDGHAYFFAWSLETWARVHLQIRATSTEIASGLMQIGWEREVVRTQAGPLIAYRKRL